MSVSMIRTIRTGANKVASELRMIATIAPMNGAFSAANRGRNFLLDSRSERFGPSVCVVSSLYFIVAPAPPGIGEVGIFWGGLHQLLVGANGEHLAFHQKDDLIIINHGCNLLGDRDQGNAGIIPVYVL